MQLMRLVVRFWEYHGLCCLGLKKMERVVETDTQQEADLGNEYMFNCMVYKVFVKRVLLEKVGF